MFKSNTLTKAVEYYYFYDMYTNEKEEIDSEDLPSLKEVLSVCSESTMLMNFLLSKEKYDLLLDDLYLLSSFFKERVLLFADDSASKFYPDKISSTFPFVVII